MNAAGLAEVLYEAFSAGDRSYPALAARIRKAEAEAVYVGGRHAEAALIVKELREKGSKAALLAGDALLTQAFWAAAGAAGEGTLLTFARDPAKNPAAAKAVTSLRIAGAVPDPFAVHAYAAVEAWAQGAAAAGTLEGKAVAAKLRSGLELDTAIGRITLDQKGDVRGAEYVWYAWSKGVLYEAPVQ
jgi:branched-chain amino acid transport system substrate-binding protein